MYVESHLMSKFNGDVLRGMTGKFLLTAPGDTGQHRTGDIHTVAMTTAAELRDGILSQNGDNYENIKKDKCEWRWG